MNNIIFKIALAEFLSGIGTGVALLAVPYYLLKESGGSEFFAIATIVSTLALFFMSPFLGDLVDKMSRRNYLAIIQFIAGPLVLFVMLGSYFFKDFYIIGLCLISFIGMGHFSAHFIGRSAYGQSIFHNDLYVRFNSVMEIVGQASTLVGGLIGALLLEHIHLYYVLTFDILTYFIAGLLFIYCPKDELENSVLKNQTASFVHGLKDTFFYFKSFPLLFGLLFFSYIPFLGVMISNYVNPVHVVESLDGGVSLLSWSSVWYSIGAMLAGIVGIRFVKNGQEVFFMKLMMIVFLILFLFSFFSDLPMIFLLCTSCVGFCNSFIRLCRSTIMMKEVPKHLIGKVNSSFNSFGLFFRVIMIGLSATLISSSGTIISLVPYFIFYLMGVFVVYLFPFRSNPTKDNL